MADTVHLTDTASVRPSLFELMAADGLLSSLHPAVRHVCSMIVSRYPGTQTWLEHRFDELFLLVNTLVQKHYLSTYAGSLADNFYGIKRIASDGAGEKLGIRLSPAKVYRSLVWLCAFPYVKAKLDSLFEDLEHQHASGVTPEQGWRRRAHQVFLRLYPVIHAVYSLSVACFYLAYLCDKSEHHSPLTWLAGVKMATVTADDWRVIEERHNKLTSWSRLRERGVPTALVLLSAHAASRLASHALQLGSFVVQFLQWWDSSGDRGSRRLGQADVPPPPPELLGKAKTLGGRCCPVCGKKRTSEAVLAVSGYVFCHVCIYRHVSEKGRCPVTWYPATTEQIYKLYALDE